VEDVRWRQLGWDLSACSRMISVSKRIIFDPFGLSAVFMLWRAPAVRI
jgi:hypothetical protein